MSIVAINIIITIRIWKHKDNHREQPAQESESRFPVGSLLSPGYHEGGNDEEEDGDDDDDDEEEDDEGENDERRRRGMMIAAFTCFILKEAFKGANMPLYMISYKSSSISTTRRECVMYNVNIIYTHAE